MRDTLACIRPTEVLGLLTEALCWSHARRKFFELADIAS